MRCKLNYYGHHQILQSGQRSFNFTQAAEKRNAENLLVIEGKPRLAAAYQRNLNEHLAHADPYQRP